MCAPFRPFLPAAAACALLLAPATGMGDSAWASRGHASATLDFRIVVPPVMRVLENSHPRQLTAETNGEWSAQQKLVVLSNMKHGFCVSMQLSAPEVRTWRLRLNTPEGLRLSPAGQGYRLCAPRAGRYTLLLDHAFALAPTTDAGAPRWPVQTDISAL